MATHWHSSAFGPTSTYVTSDNEHYHNTPVGRLLTAALVGYDTTPPSIPDGTGTDLGLSLLDDLDIVGGDLRLVGGVEAIDQHLTTRLRFFKGEWMLDQSVGVPYFDSIFVKAPNLAVIRAIYNRAILTTPGIESVTSLDVTFDQAARRLRVSFAATTVDGPLTYDEEIVI